ncbi:MAG: SLC13 family permease [Candidatus Promineifilaceae bacterium]|nr:SLC13 family permease [Candidatus Promineifilaceae bacterium]
MIALIIGAAIVTPSSLQAQEADTLQPQTCAVTGNLRDSQGQPVAAVEVTLADRDGAALLSVESQPDGRYLLPWPADQAVPSNLELQYERPHFENATLPLSETQREELSGCQAVAVPIVELERQITPAFWIAAVVFAIVLAFIAMGTLHNTLAALLGASILFAFSYLGPLVDEGLFIFEFERSLEFVDWNVIFLIMGMMIVIAVIERTGIFQWSALQAYKLSGGRRWLLVIILMVITGVASAFLDNVTTMLLMTPITIQIALSLGMNPLALLMPEVMASNVIGISTLVGTPTNILIGSFAEISFSDFLINLTPGVVLAMVGLVLYHEYIYRKELRGSQEESGISNVLLARLQERGQIEEPEDLRKAGIVGAGMIILFVIGEQFHLLPSVTAIMGATALMVWIRPDIDEMIESVDWTTLVFFIALFICVGGVQEVGLISFIAAWIGDLVGENLVLAMLAVTWLSAFLSTVIANIPFTAAMLPVVGFLSGNIPGADNKVLFYCLSVGSAMGGNGSLIGASANMVTAGIADRAGTPITYVYFLKKGLPALIITVALAMIWLFIRFL